MAGTVMKLNKQEKKHLGETIRAIRTAQKMSAEELSKRVGVNVSTVSSWETGNQAPVLENAVIIARVLNVPLSTLLNQQLAAKAKSRGLNKLAGKQEPAYELASTTLKMLREQAQMSIEEASQWTGIRAERIDNFETKGISLSVFERLTLEKAYHLRIDKLKKQQAEQSPTHEESETQLETPAPAPKLEVKPRPMPEPIITMIPQDTSLSGFRQSIIDNLIRAAKVSTDPAVKKLADVLALIDEYEGERRCSEGTESQVA